MRPVVSVVAVLLASRLAQAEIFSYECDTLPVPAGWTQLQVYCNPDQWIEKGKLIQHLELCPGVTPPSTQSLDYGRSLAAYIGVPTFFVEWRMETDGDQSGILYGSPAIVSAWSNGPTNYHFVVARDRLRFVRDTFLPILYIDYAPNVAHTFRLELVGDVSYAFYIDDELKDSGVPEGPYPFFNPGLNIHASMKFEPTTTAWDYVRYGEIPVDGSGDYDGSGTLELRDFYFVAECIAEGGPGTDARRGCHFADMDADTDVDLHDFGAFQVAFTGD